MREHHTEAGEWLAIWRLDRRAIRILLVCNAFDREPVHVAAAANAPDLADMRDRLPKLAPLWDAIRHQYWSSFPTVHDPAHVTEAKGRI
ncbi:hypothetical protein C5E45_00490 [Nocardia nova]|uniref:Uncharacterized protein n=1 Tax=Nocardia nova TaxID=37330 RepID=A0A2S6AWU1_9NOCA|nr:hypothetical protein [Nocardia nova]PPJ28359.1 hypothetical protein C5E41_13710 [Nocardia nova]PPJ39678.1 hypothetical protein C5E45_00490 [Nocardia nova]